MYEYNGILALPNVQCSTCHRVAVHTHTWLIIILLRVSTSSCRVLLTISPEASRVLYDIVPGIQNLLCCCSGAVVVQQYVVPGMLDFCCRHTWVGSSYKLPLRTKGDTRLPVLPPHAFARTFTVVLHGAIHTAM